MRDDFSQSVKDLLGNRVGWKCSNPNCRKPTRGAGVEKTNIINIGVQLILQQHLKVDRDTMKI